MALTCNNNFLLPFSATFTVPNEFGLEDPDKFSIAISTKNLIAYKTIVDQTITNTTVVCDKTIDNLKIKIGQVNLTGSIIFRVAANGIKSDEITIDPNIPESMFPDVDVTFEPAWSSVDGIATIKNEATNESFITLAYIPASEEIVDKPFKVYLSSMEVSYIGEEPTSNDKTVTISGYFRLVYNPLV